VNKILPNLGGGGTGVLQVGTVPKAINFDTGDVMSSRPHPASLTSRQI
jgi:hypothetical protein